MATPKSGERLSAAERLDADLTRLSLNARLNDWTSFIQELNVPSDVMPAILSGRPELVELATPRTLTPEEHATYLKLMAGYIRTNMALREHAETLAQLVQNWTDAFKHLKSLGERIERFANFKHAPSEQDDDD